MGTRALYGVALLYMLVCELPCKVVVRLLQGERRYVRSCWLGFCDAVAHRMGRGRILEAIG